MSDRRADRPVDGSVPIAPDGPFIAVSFEAAEPHLVDDVIGALVDMTLTQLGATVDMLEAAHLGLGEIIAAISAGGALRRVELRRSDERLRLDLVHDSVDPVFEPGARDVAEAAFSTIVFGAGRIEIEATARPEWSR